MIYHPVDKYTFIVYNNEILLEFPSYVVTTMANIAGCPADLGRGCPTPIFGFPWLLAEYKPYGYVMFIFGAPIHAG